MSKIKPIILDTFRHWREASIVFLSQILFGFILAFSFYSEMHTSFQNSMILENLAKGFDRTVIMDLLNAQEGVLSSTKGLAAILLFMYVLLGVFLQGGWISNIRRKEYSLSSWFKNGLKFYFPFLGIACIALVLFLFFGGIVGFLFTALVGDPLVTFSSEKPYVLWIVFLVCVFAFWTILVWSWSVSARLMYIDGLSFFSATKKGLHRVKVHFGKYVAIGLLVIGIHVFLMFLYYWIMGDRGASTWTVVIVGIVFQQMIAFARVILRGFSYGLIEDLNVNGKI